MTYGPIGYHLFKMGLGNYMIIYATSAKKIIKLPEHLVCECVAVARRK